MARYGKRVAELKKKVVPGKLYSIKEAVALAKECANTKFDETMEVAVRLNVDPRHAEQQVRNTVVLPNGTGKTKRIVVLTSTEQGKDAEAAGADFVGGQDLVTKIAGGWLDFEAVIATPEMMRFVGRLGKVLGPRGLMPSAKTGTVTTDVVNAVKEIKAGRVEFRVDKFGILHNGFGKASFAVEKLEENLRAYYAAVLKVRPATVKGDYVKSISISSTMGIGIRIDPSEKVVTEAEGQAPKA